MDGFDAPFANRPLRSSVGARPAQAVAASRIERTSGPENRRLDLQVPEPFEYPAERRTFFKHAERARQALGWHKFDRGFRSATQEWLDVEARRSDDPDYLQHILESRLRTDQVIPPATSTVERMIAQARVAAQEQIIDVIVESLSKKQKEQIDKLREFKRGTRHSHLQWIKEAPGNASPRVLSDLLERIEFIRGPGLPDGPFEVIHPDMRRRLTATVQVYSVDSLFADLIVDKRRAYMACYLHERLSALVDLAIEAFEDVATGMYRRSESDRDEDVRRRAPAVNHKLRLFGAVVDVVLDPEIPDGAVREQAFGQTNYHLS